MNQRKGRSKTVTSIFGTSYYKGYNIGQNGTQGIIGATGVNGYAYLNRLEDEVGEGETGQTLYHNATQFEPQSLSTLLQSLVTSAVTIPTFDTTTLARASIQVGQLYHLTGEDTVRVLLAEDFYSTPFISQWTTSTTSAGSSNSDQIRLPLVENGEYNMTVDWGDGSSDLITAYDQAEVTHTYSSEDTYDITISGQCHGFSFNNGGDRLKLVDISQWGERFKLDSATSIHEGYFYGCYNMDISATDALDLSTTTSLKYMFTYCYSMNANLGGWDLSTITDLSYCFNGIGSFNNGGSSDIGDWDVSNVTTMREMFRGCNSLSQDLGDWDVSSCTDFTSMFREAGNTPCNWSTLKTTGTKVSVEFMFGNNSNFNQPLNNWNVSNVNNWQNFMNNTDAFNQDLSSWSPSSATIFRTAFRNMANFEGIGVKEWDVSSCTDFFGVFANCASFAEDLSAGATGSWQMESASNMADMFLDTTLTTEKYDNLLYHFANLPSVPTSITFHGGDSYYTDTTSHDALTGTYSWTITDLGVLPYEDHVLADSPIVYYQFEDGTGATEVADSSGNDHHGTISNTVELGATGINSGYCINVVDDASLESGISLPLLTSGSTGATDFSIEWWMKPENVITGDIRIFSSTSGATAKRLEFFIRASKLRSMIGSDGSATFIDTAFNADEWSHIVITYKQSNGETKGYLNGVLSDTITETTGYGGFNQGEAYHLGYSPNYGAQYEGLIDEFAMYEHILSADRVAAHYNART